MNKTIGFVVGALTLVATVCAVARVLGRKFSSAKTHAVDDGAFP